MPRPSSADGVVVAQVRPRSPAADAGLLAGDRLVSINGVPLRDSIDFHFQAGEASLSIELDRNGRMEALTVRRREGRELGVVLLPPRPAEISTCANKCVFCFIHQLPKGLRKSLYVKDDDYRLSFLHGNYITLTDLPEEDLARIERQRLSPLYVSVHATDPELRWALLGNPRVKGELLPRMKRLARAGIRMHAQIVLCPGWNDGAHLEKSVGDLAELHPAVSTVAVVPVGLTRYRQRLPALRTVTSEEARNLVSAIEGWQREYQRRLGSRLVFAADELYLEAGLEPPPARDYEGFPLLEDGVGLVRRFTEGFERALRRLPRAVGPPRSVSVVTGEMFAPRLTALLDKVAVDWLTATVVPVENIFFGGNIAVAGLLTGQDILAQLSGRAVGDLVLLPDAALRDEANVFLDDLTPADLEARLQVPVRAVEPTPRALLKALLGNRPTV
jgi:putative radical SAM enzyme (TIGR03279 family)